MPKKFVAVNGAGRRIGQDHPRAKLANHEIELIVKLYEEHPVGDPRHMGYRQLARKFEVHRQTIAKIVRAERRCQSPERFRLVVPVRLRINLSGRGKR